MSKKIILIIVLIIFIGSAFGYEFIGKSRANLVISITNQSRYKSNVKLKVYIDDKLMISNNFKVKDSHTVIDYYYSLPKGNHKISVASDKNTRFEGNIDINEERQYAFISYFHSENSSPKIYFKVSNKRFGID